MLSESERPARGTAEGEIDIIEYLIVLWQNKISILVITIIFAIAAGGLSFLLPNIYRAEVLMAPATDESEGGLSLSGALASLGGVAGLPGLSQGSNRKTEEYLAVLRSRSFIWAFVEEFHLMPVLFANEWDTTTSAWQYPDSAPQMLDVYELIVEDGLLSVMSQGDSGLISLAVEWSDPELSARWANALVDRLNSFLRERERVRTESNLTYLNEELARTQVAEIRQSLFALITKEYTKAMLVNTQNEYAFRVLDAAVSPIETTRPKHLLIAIISGFLGGAIAIFAAFFREGVRRRNLTQARA